MKRSPVLSTLMPQSVGSSRHQDLPTRGREKFSWPSRRVTAGQAGKVAEGGGLGLQARVRLPGLRGADPLVLPGPLAAPQHELFTLPVEVLSNGPNSIASGHL